jgi:hypothetical protein
VTTEDHYEVCEKNGDCQERAVIYYIERKWKGRGYYSRTTALCERHAGPAARKALERPLDHEIILIGQSVLPIFDE